MLRTLGNAQQPLLGLVERSCSRLKPAPKHIALPEVFEGIPPTSEDALNKVVTALDNRSQAWIDMPPKDRAKLLRSCLNTTLDVAEEAAEAATCYKGSWGGGIGEELLSFLPIVSGMRELAEALEANGTPRPARLFRHPTTNQWIADAFPTGLESLLFGGFQGEVWIEPGKDPSQGQAYRSPPGTIGGGVGLVLGAGNQTPVVALDILHVLVVDNRVVVCKMNPVNEYMGPYLRRALLPLVDAGFLEFVYGGGPQGTALCNHPLVRTVHLTGSAATYDAIVWGGKPKVGAPPFQKPVSAELGCITPYIIVPGTWSADDIEYHADTVVSGLVQNAGHNCLKAEIVVTDAEWPQREAFLTAVRRKLAATPTRVAYYPGSGRKAGNFKSKFPDAEEIGGSTVAVGNGELHATPAGQSKEDLRRLPWMLKTGLSPEEAATNEEFWCGVLQEVALPSCGGDAGKFLGKAVDFANEKCWGTLSCAMIAHPATQKAYAKEFEAAIAALRYGTICINTPGMVGFALTKLSWGGFPGSTPEDIGSGNCKVHNTLLFDHVEKSVVRGPWRFHPYPFWSVSHRNTEEMAKGAMRFMAGPSLLRMLPLVPKAVLG